MKYLFLAILWTGYCALHSALISIRFTAFMNRLLKRYYAFYRIAYVLISIVLLIPIIRYSDRLNDAVIITYGPLADTIRIFLASGSLMMFFWAFFISYDSLSFLGLRQILHFHRKKTEDSPGEIQKDGLLGIVRHPMYFAVIIYLWCHTYRILDVIVNIILTIYIVVGTKLEERKLVLEFGDAYIRYQQEVPMLIPFSKIRMKPHPLKNMRTDGCNPNANPEPQ